MEMARAPSLCRFRVLRDSFHHSGHRHRDNCCLSLPPIPRPALLLLMPLLLMQLLRKQLLLMLMVLPPLLLPRHLLALSLLAPPLLSPPLQCLDALAPTAARLAVATATKTSARRLGRP